MYEILSDLQPEDRFNILTFESNINFVYNEFIQATPKNLIDGKKQIKRLSADGGTHFYLT